MNYHQCCSLGRAKLFFDHTACVGRGFIYRIADGFRLVLRRVAYGFGGIFRCGPEGISVLLSRILLNSFSGVGRSALSRVADCFCGLLGLVLSLFCVRLHRVSGAVRSKPEEGSSGGRSNSSPDDCSASSCCGDGKWSRSN
jgi:hypothetical protein